MQSWYAIAWLKLKLFDSAAESGCLHFNVAEKRRVQLSQNFWFFFLSYITAVINSFKQANSENLCPPPLLFII